MQAHNVTFSFHFCKKVMISYFSINFFLAILLSKQLENLPFQSFFDVTLSLYNTLLPVQSTHITNQDAATFHSQLAAQ